MLKQNLQVGRTPSLQCAQAAGEAAWSTFSRRPLLAAHAFAASALPRCAVEQGAPFPQPARCCGWHRPCGGGGWRTRSAALQPYVVQSVEKNGRESA